MYHFAAGNIEPNAMLPLAQHTRTCVVSKGRLPASWPDNSVKLLQTFPLGASSGPSHGLAYCPQNVATFVLILYDKEGGGGHPDTDTHRIRREAIMSIRAFATHRTESSY